ncbi:transcriptional regulator, ArsR family [Dehalococcoides mccartyi CBDB1]|uniref:Transcriptional regulator, ArsR family n=2 Tax=Dehalococcoides mccartyi TaxID=61435 RepID=A0A916KMU7_DEHMC|nr:sporulation delaying system autorepressor SdpR [Dehalococcoides mccartyi]CAI83256.1 transcriptional regulator, ArsR family [Dehalococcoides mccartyi CBDB1]
MDNMVFKALSDPNRRQILKLLSDAPLSAGEISREFDLALSTLSGHFKLLKEAGLIREEKKGNHIFYNLNTSVMEEALNLMMEIFKKDKPQLHTIKQKGQ